MTTASELRVVLDDLITGNHILAHHGVVDCYGHLSARDPRESEHFLLAWAVAPALVTEADILTFDLNGDRIGEDDRELYSERFLHAAIYAARPDVQCALMLITDYALRRFQQEARAEDKRFPGTWCIGADVRNGVKFNKAVWALANQARHHHEWCEQGHNNCLADPRIRPSYVTIQQIDLDPFRLNAARELVAGGNGLNLDSYAGYEELVLRSVAADIAGGDTLRTAP